MKVGIIGLGKMGLLHAGIINSLKNTELVAITEKEKIILKYLNEVIPGVNPYEDFDEMFHSENLDVAYITTPVSTHVPIALKCVENKINFFMEKPLSRSIYESTSLIEKLEKTNLIHMVGFNRRFVDTFVHLKSILDEEILGNVFEVKASVYSSDVLSRGTGWRSNKNVSGGGVMLDLGSHVIDLLIWFFGKFTSVKSDLTSIYSKEVEDSAHVNFNLEKSITGTIDASWSTEGYRVPEISIDISGENGKILVTEDYIKFFLNKDVGKTSKNSVIYKQALNQGVSIDVGGPDYTKEDTHMFECVENENQTLSNVFEASKTQCVIQAIYDSNEKKEESSVNYIV